MKKAAIFNKGEITNIYVDLIVKHFLKMTDMSANDLNINDIIVLEDESLPPLFSNLEANDSRKTEIIKRHAAMHNKADYFVIPNDEDFFKYGWVIRGKNANVIAQCSAVKRMSRDYRIDKLGFLAPSSITSLPTFKSEFEGRKIKVSQTNQKEIDRIFNEILIPKECSVEELKLAKDNLLTIAYDLKCSRAEAIVSYSDEINDLLNQSDFDDIDIRHISSVDAHTRLTAFELSRSIDSPKELGKKDPRLVYELSQNT